MDIKAGQAPPEAGRDSSAPRRVWPAVRTGLEWSGAVVYPAVTYITFDHGQQGFDLLMVLATIALTAVVASLLRRRPLPALALLLLAGVAATMEMRKTEVSYLQTLAGVCAVGYLAAARSRRVSVPAALMTFTTQVVGLFAFPPDEECFPGGYPANGCQSSGWAGDDVETVGFIAVALIAAWMVGSSARERRAHAEALRSQATARAITAERLRIARELHDMIAHSIGVIAIQAGVGSRVIDTQPAEARGALTTIEATSRETLASLRRTLVALRKPETAAEGAAGAADLTPREPAPGLADLDRLVASALDAGVRVAVRWTGERRPLPADIDLAAFRILQEALTNVIRHAGTDSCRVRVELAAAELSVEVEDDGRGGLSAGTGLGLVGMRERVALLHGRFTAGPRPEGGFRVAAVLPVPVPVPEGER
ncbi:sensor histidine kinase [Streptomyces sp. NPDC050658]|uniref:sensor histidine kinase n=1 Tax=unclassified Streptomyces TaxID=2593676 RepID=UPI003413A8CE